MLWKIDCKVLFCFSLILLEQDIFRTSDFNLKSWVGRPSIRLYCVEGMAMSSLSSFKVLIGTIIYLSLTVAERGLSSAGGSSGGLGTEAAYAECGRTHWLSEPLSLSRNSTFFIWFLRRSKFQFNTLRLSVPLHFTIMLLPFQCVFYQVRMNAAQWWVLTGYLEKYPILQYLSQGGTSPVGGVPFSLGEW